VSKFHADVAEAIEGEREDEQAIAVLVVRENDDGIRFSLIMDPPTQGEGGKSDPPPHQILIAFVEWMTATMQLGTETQFFTADDEEPES
jgi:hypothetical protein